MEENQSSVNKRIAKNTMFMYLRMLVSMVVSLYTARITINALGFDNYGIYNIVGSIIVFFTFLNQGLSTATRRYVTAEFASGTPESQRNLFNLAIVSHMFIALIILVIAETIGLAIVNTVLNIPSDRMFAANVAYQLSVVAALLAVMQVPFSVAITANERMNIYAYISILDIVFKLAVAYGVLYLSGDKLIIYSVLLFIVGVLDILVYRLYCYRSFPMCKYIRPHGRGLLKEMFKYMGWNLIGQLMVLLTNQGVSVLVNMFFSVAANAAMGISNQITGIVNGFVSNFQIAFNPQITKQYVAKQFDTMNALAIRSARMSSFLVLVFMIPICFQIRNFLSVWLGNYPDFAVEFCVLTLISIFIDSTSAPLWMILSSDKNVKKYQIAISFVYSFNFIGAWVLLYLGFPPYSVIIARILVYCIAIVTRLFLVKEKVPSYPVIFWLKEVVVKSLIIIAIPMFILLSISSISFGSEVVDLLFFSGMAFILTAIPIYVIGLKQNERNFINQKVVSILHLN